MNKNTFVTSVAFVGQPNVGKSTLLNKLIGIKIAPTTRKPQTTRKIIRGIKTQNNYQQIYFDTPGAVQKTTNLHRYMHQEINSALNNVDQVVLITDISEPIFKHIEFIKHVLERAKKNSQNLILVLNKIDKLKNKQEILEKIKTYYEQTNISHIIPISAQNNNNLDSLFNQLNKQAQPRDFLFDSSLFTDSTEKELSCEIIREKAMLELSDELPYRVAVTIDSFDESRRENPKKPIISIEAILHVERDSQKPIIIGAGGATIKKIGSRARRDLEYILDCQIMLKLFVRVEPNWTTSAKGLKKLGY